MLTASRAHTDTVFIRAFQAHQWERGAQTFSPRWNPSEMSLAVQCLPVERIAASLLSPAAARAELMGQQDRRQPEYWRRRSEPRVRPVVGGTCISVGGVV